MSKVEITSFEEEIDMQTGDIYVNNSSGSSYILCNDIKDVSRFTLVNLETGNNFCSGMSFEQLRKDLNHSFTRVKGKITITQE